MTLKFGVILMVMVVNGILRKAGVQHTENMDTIGEIVDILHVIRPTRKQR